MAEIKDGMGTLIMGFVFLLVGVVLFGVIADSIYGITTETQTSTNESVALSGGSGQTAQRNLTVVTQIYNGTTAQSIDVTENCTTILVSGAINCSDSAVGAGAVLLVTYTYSLQDFVNDTASRSLILLINIFFALAILAGAVVVGISGFQKMGMM